MYFLVNALNFRSTMDLLKKNKKERNTKKLTTLRIIINIQSQKKKKGKERK